MSAALYVITPSLVSNVKLAVGNTQSRVRRLQLPRVFWLSSSPWQVCKRWGTTNWSSRILYCKSFQLLEIGHSGSFAVRLWDMQSRACGTPNQASKISFFILNGAGTVWFPDGFLLFLSLRGTQQNQKRKPFTTEKQEIREREVKMWRIRQ